LIRLDFVTRQTRPHNSALTNGNAPLLFRLFILPFTSDSSQSVTQK